MPVFVPAVSEPATDGIGVRPAEIPRGERELHRRNTGDGVTTLRGNVDIRQGTLRITADEAEVTKIDGRVSSVTFRGQPAFLEQEIEEQGLVQATANIIDYQVASGIVTLTGNADVKHPQYQISGELLTYDLNVQHFQGSGDENGNGRIHILLDPEVINSERQKGQEE